MFQMSVQSATIRKWRCNICNEFVTGALLFILNHEKNCAEITQKFKGQKLYAVKTSYGTSKQNDTLQGSHILKKQAYITR